jgi:2-dehydro-3-deoxyphosphogluconate aldolase / (4S)-4-hydroxy-2-oxoglutarate aldolase
MQKTEVCKLIREIGVVPAVRASSAEEAHFAADAVINGGIPIVEITMTVPQAVECISDLVRRHEKTLVVGAGTVLDIETAKRCIDAGASFLTAPGFEVDIVEFAAKANLVVMPGALTPSEVVQAWKTGADLVKVFPCELVGGDKYIKTLKRSLPQVPLVAGGGITQRTAVGFILAGATAIGVGTELIPEDAIRRREAGRIQELALRFVGFVKEARDLLGPEKEIDPTVRTNFLKLHRHHPR